MKVTRINSGIYKITNQGRTFQCEKTEDGQWIMLLFVNSGIEGIEGSYDYCQHYITLSDCKHIIKNNINEF
jgi:hypothetical protein